MRSSLTHTLLAHIVAANNPRRVTDVKMLAAKRQQKGESNVKADGWEQPSATTRLVTREFSTKRLPFSKSFKFQLVAQLVQVVKVVRKCMRLAFRVFFGSLQKYLFRVYLRNPLVTPAYNIILEWLPPGNVLGILSLFSVNGRWPRLLTKL